MFQSIDYSTLEVNPFSMLSSDTFLITAGTAGSWNTMTAAWGSLGYLWNRPVFTIVVRDSRYTYGFLEKSEGFTCSFFAPQYKDILTFCGSHSGRDTDKAAATGLVPVEISGPHDEERITFDQANLVFSCTKASRVPFDPAQFITPDIISNYPNKDYHYMYIGYIDQVLISEE